MTALVPNELAKAYLQHRLLPFVGAGASMSFSWKGPDGHAIRGPSWKEFVDHACHVLNFADPDLLRVRGTDIQILEYYRATRGGGAGEFAHWLNQRINPSDDELRGSRLHQSLSRLERCREFYTTNFDDLLERALTLHGRECSVVVKEAHLPVRSGATAVIKYHGDIKNPDKMVLSEADYLRRMRLEDALDVKFRADLLNRVVLFIGYGFGDGNVAYLFQMVSEMMGRFEGSGSGRRGFIIVKRPSEFERELFAARGLEVIAADNDLTTFVAEFLDELAGV